MWSIAPESRTHLIIILEFWEGNPIVKLYLFDLISTLISELVNSLHFGLNLDFVLINLVKLELNCWVYWFNREARRDSILLSLLSSWLELKVTSSFSFVPLLFIVFVSCWSLCLRWNYGLITQHLSWLWLFHLQWAHHSISSFPLALEWWTEKARSSDFGFESEVPIASHLAASYLMRHVTSLKDNLSIERRIWALVTYNLNQKLLERCRHDMFPLFHESRIGKLYEIDRVLIHCILISHARLLRYVSWFLCDICNFLLELLYLRMSFLVTVLILNFLP
jgi:hypothetical protein